MVTLIKIDKPQNTLVIGDYKSIGIFFNQVKFVNLRILVVLYIKDSIYTVYISENAWLMASSVTGSDCGFALRSVIQAR